MLVKLIKNKNAGYGTIALFYDTTVLHYSIESVGVGTPHFLQTPYGVPIKWFISTQRWSGSPLCLQELCVIYDL